MTTQKIAALLMAGMVVVSMGGCSKEGNPSPSQPPTFDDGSPPLPEFAYDENGLPAPMGLHKGGAEKAITTSLALIKKDIDINEQLRLQTILTGYYGFNEYALSKVTDKGSITEYYANNAYYSPKESRVVVNIKDMVTGKKILIT